MTALSTGQFPAEAGGSGAFVRQANAFTGRLDVPETGRYVLYVSLACPWAHRVILVRRLLGLEDALPMRVVDPFRDERGWAFTLDEGGRDPVTGAEFLMELYQRTDPGFTGRATVPCVWDTREQRIVTNDYPQITLDLSLFWRREGYPDLYPEPLRPAIDAMAQTNFETVNNGVYLAGFATSQDAYDQAYDALFARLYVLDRLLSRQRYLLGDTLTEADLRLFTTLVRFDAVYHGHFKCNRQKLAEFTHLWPYARDVFQQPGIGETVNFTHIKRHYYATHEAINPTRIVPKGPATDWREPAHRS